MPSVRPNGATEAIVVTAQFEHGAAIHDAPQPAQMICASGKSPSSAVPFLVVTLKIRYRGTPAPVESFDSLLTAEGLRVDHKPVVEGSGGRDAIVWVMLYVADPAASGDIDVDQDAPVRPKVESAIAKFKLQHPHVQVEIVEASVAQPPGHH